MCSVPDDSKFYVAQAFAMTTYDYVLALNVAHNAGCRTGTRITHFHPPNLPCPLPSCSH